jgi:hypothetical protein
MWLIYALANENNRSMDHGLGAIFRFGGVIPLADLLPE